MSVLSGRYGCRTWVEFDVTRRKNSSSSVWTGRRRPADRRCSSRAACCDARGQWLNTYQTMPARRTQSARWQWHGRCRAEMWLACRARGAHALRTACGCSTTAAWWRGQRLSAQLKQQKNNKKCDITHYHIANVDVLLSNSERFLSGAR